MAPNYRFAVYGSNGLAEILKPTLEDFRFSPKPDPTVGHLAIVQPQLVRNPGFDTLHAELTAFAACIRDPHTLSDPGRRGPARRGSVRGHCRIRPDRQSGRDRMTRCGARGFAGRDEGSEVAVGLLGRNDRQQQVGAARAAGV